MATLHPFRAQRPHPDWVKQVASVPYDVIGEKRARHLAAENPYSFLRVIRPEVDLPPRVEEHDEEVYEQGAANLREFVREDHTVQEAEPSLYVYRLSSENGHVQTGLFGCVAVDDYDKGQIVRHEETRPDKVTDRKRHILAQRAHPEPVMLTYRDREDVQRQITEVKKEAPLYDFTARDGVRHTLWRAPQTGALAEAFEDIDYLYIADGHHRCKASSRAAKELDASSEAESSDSSRPEYAFFPAILFPMSMMRILAYHRLVIELPASPADFLHALEAELPVERAVRAPEPPVKGMVSLYLDGTWHRAELPPTRGHTAADALDVSRLSEHVLEPLLGITDQRNDSNLDFVGGLNGIEKLERRVDQDRAQLAIAMYPTSIEELVAVADAGELMPPKSTWFDPKPASGLLVHLF